MRVFPAASVTAPPCGPSPSGPSPWVQSSPTTPRPARAPVAVVVLLAALAIGPYLNALNAGFTFDDDLQIRANSAVTQGVDLTAILSAPLHPGDLFRPFTVLTFALNEALAPGAPGPCHLVNVWLHAVVTILVYLLAKRLFKSVRLATIAGALFAVHPIHTEAVTSLVGRAELLAGCLGLGAMLAAVRADGRRGIAATGLRMLSLVFFSLALLSKESAFTLVPLIFLLRITLRQESLRTGAWRELRSLEWLAYLLCAGLFIALRAHVISAPVPVPPLDNVLLYVPWPIRMRSALGILWEYFGLLNVPWVLAADYSYNEVPPITSWTAPHFLAGLALLLAAATVCVRRRWTPVAFALVFPFIALSLTANLLFPIGTIKAERLLYLPSVGWALLAACGGEWLLRRRRYRVMGAVVLCAIVTIFAARTWVRNADWRDNDALYRSMVENAPGSAKARYNLGTLLLRQGHIAAASVQFHRALEIYPWAEGAARNIGIGFEKAAQTEQAVEWYTKALAIAPGFHDGHLSLCSVLVNSGRLDQAAAACRGGLRYWPADPALLRGLGIAMIGTGAMVEGVETLRRSLALNPQDDALRAYLSQREAVPVAGPAATP